MHILNIIRNKWLHSTTKYAVLSKIKFPSISVARQRTEHLLNLFSMTLLQNIANTLSDRIGEIKSPLLYCFLDLK